MATKNQTQGQQPDQNQGQQNQSSQGQTVPEQFAELAQQIVDDNCKGCKTGKGRHTCTIIVQGQFMSC